MGVMDAGPYINPNEIYEPYTDSLAQKLRKAGGIYPRAIPSPYTYIYIYAKLTSTFDRP